MCRNIKTLFNFEPPATEDEIQASALQFVRKLSGFNKPSQANAEAFDRAVEDRLGIEGIGCGRCHRHVCCVGGRHTYRHSVARARPG